MSADGSADPRIAKLAGILRNRRERIRNFIKFTPKEGQERRNLDDLYPEQEEIVSDREKYSQNLYLKPRNVGAGTILQADDVMYATVTRDPVSTLVVVHDDEAKKRHMERYREFWGNLPPYLKRDAYKNNEDELILKDRNGQPGASFRSLIASGKSEGKGSTFQRVHFTEVGDYEEGRAENLVGSVLAAVHPGPHFAVVVESTSKGPGRYFARLWAEKQLDENWHCRFFKWSRNPIYTRTVPNPRRFEDSLTDEERIVQRAHHLSLEQLAFRREKVSMTGLTTFRHYYPLTPEEAFWGGGVGFFPEERLAGMLAAAPKTGRKRGLYRFEQWSPLKLYAIGVDVSHGLGKEGNQGKGGDFSVIQVVDHMGNQVAVWSDDRTAPQVVAEQVVLLASEYGNALVLIEANGPGIVTLQRMRQIGYPYLWLDNGKDFVTWGTSVRGQTVGGKQAIFHHARQKLIDNTVSVLDSVTIDELQSVRENAKGTIEGSGRYDDHAMAWVLAIWCMKRIEAHYHDPVKAMDALWHFGSSARKPTTPFGR